MKYLFNRKKARILIAAIILLSSCKVYIDKEISGIPPTVSLVQTQGGTITLKPEALTVDKANLLVKKTLGVAYAGYESNETFTANVELDYKNVPAGYEHFTASECYLSLANNSKDASIVEVLAGTKNQPFYVNVTKAGIEAHSGKKTAAKVRISSVSKYTLNTQSDSVLLIMDMNDFGTVKLDITETYIKNPTFKRAAGTTARFCNLADWIANEAVTNSRPTGAGYDDNVGKMGIERWGSWDNPIINGKIYQTFTLPNGKYRFEVNMGQVIPDRDTYFVVADGSDLPNDTQIATAIASKAITSDFNTTLLPLDFTLPASKKISAGFLLNFDQGLQKVLQVTSIKLYKIESLFD